MTHSSFWCTASLFVQLPYAASNLFLDLAPYWAWCQCSSPEQGQDDSTALGILWGSCGSGLVPHWAWLLRSKGLKGAMCTGLLVWWMSVANWKLSVLSVYKGLTPLAPGMCDSWYSIRPKLVYRAGRGGELQRGLWSDSRVRETLLKSAVEATSLGLKTKSGLMLRSKGLKGAMCTSLLVWRMLVADWKLLVLSVHKRLTPLVPGICGRWYSARPRLVYRARGGKGASKGTLKWLKGKGNSSQERCRSYKSWIENQVRLKAQL